MDITEVSIIHHIAIVLFLLWACAKFFGWCPSIIYFFALLYLYQVNKHYTTRLQKRLQFEERKTANQKRLLSGSESVRWLNHAIEKIWPLCMEHIASQQFLLPIIPWFLDKYKPWTVQKASVQTLYLGRRPPIITDIRVLVESADDDHLVLELGMNFLTGEDMNAVLSVQLAKRLGLGITTNMHITSMHVEGRVLVGVKFLRHWPFLGRVRLCFVEPPYFQMAVKPIFGHGVDVTEIPGVSGWLEKLLDTAFGETLVEPNMLVVDVEKFVSAPEETWFTVKEKPPIAYVKLEILEGADMKPSDLNGLADPYVKVQFGPQAFQTNIQRKTLSPKWQEEFSVPVTSWEGTNVLVLQVRDKDHIFDDFLGECEVNISDLKREQRHDMWLPLNNIKMGRIHLAITVQENLPKGESDLNDDGENDEKRKVSENSYNEMVDNKTGKNQDLTEEYEPIDVKGQERTGIWVHRPGNDVPQTWESRKGRAHNLEVQLNREEIGNNQSRSSSASDSQNSDCVGNEVSNKESNGKTQQNKLSASLSKVGSMFRRSSSKVTSPREDSEKEGPGNQEKEVAPLPRPHRKQGGQKKISVKLEVDDNSDSTSPKPNVDTDFQCSELDNTTSPQGNSKDKNFSSPTKNYKSVLSKKDSSYEVQSSSTVADHGMNSP